MKNNFETYILKIPQVNDIYKYKNELFYILSIIYELKLNLKIFLEISI